jgi:predicted kinase
MSSLIIIRGPLGIGKSTIAKKLAERIKGEYISIDDVLDRNNLDQVDQNEGWIPLANFLRVNEYILPKINLIIKNGVSVIIDGNFYHEDQLKDLISSFPSNNHVFTLTASLETCIQRDSQRLKPYGVSATADVYKLVSRFEYGKVIDVSLKPVEETVNFIISSLV